jgi:hypothetical protein
LARKRFNWLENLGQHEDWLQGALRRFECEEKSEMVFFRSDLLPTHRATKKKEKRGMNSTKSPTVTLGNENILNRFTNNKRI